MGRYKKLTKRQANKIVGAWLYGLLVLGDDPDSELLSSEEASLVTEQGNRMLSRYGIEGVTTLDEIIKKVTGRTNPHPKRLKP